MSKDLSSNLRRLAQAQRTISGDDKRRAPASRQPRPVKENPPAPPRAPTGAKPRAPARPVQPPRKPGLNLKQMLNATAKYFPSRVENAERDNVTIPKMQKKGDAILCESLTYNGTKKVPEIRKHKQIVRKRAVAENDPNRILPFSLAKVHVSCTCEDHLYTFEYALAERDAAKITYSNSEFPIIKNPKLIPGLCKHLWVVVNKILEKGV